MSLKEVFKRRAYFLHLHISEGNYLCFVESFYEIFICCFHQFKDPCVWLCCLVFMVIHSEAQLICYTHLIPILNRLVALIIIIYSITARIKHPSRM